MVAINVLSDEAARTDKKTLDLNLHSPERQLIELKIEHADLNALVDMAAQALPVDELRLRRLKKRRLQLRDQISFLLLSLDPPEPA
jgi:hypothetical protein